jgi:phage terminase small subunit
MGQCTAKSVRSQKQCRRAAILGGTVCIMHGGKAPQVIAAAQRRLELAQITPDRTLLEIARVAYSDVASFFNPDGTLKKPAELDEDQRACLAGFEASIQNVAAGDGKQDLIHKFKAWDKTKALEMLARHFGMFNDKLDVNVTLNDEINKRVTAGRRRAAQRNAQPSENTTVVG